MKKNTFITLLVTIIFAAFVIVAIYNEKNDDTTEVTSQIVLSEESIIL